MSELDITAFSLFITLVIYFSSRYLQQYFAVNLLNPMVLSIVLIVPGLHYVNLSFEQYMYGGKWLNYLLEPAVVALGYPLFEQVKQIKRQWKSIIATLLLGCFLAVGVSLGVALLVGSSQALAVSMALKSITTPVALELTDLYQGIPSITAIAIIVAGLCGASFGMPWLGFLGVTNPKAQGLAIGAGSHVLGTATISHLSYEHGAYGALALIVSALLTTLICPVLIPFLLSL